MHQIMSMWHLEFHKPPVLATFKRLGTGGKPTIKLFADNCILLRQNKIEVHIITLQQDPNTVVQWSEK